MAYDAVAVAKSLERPTVTLPCWWAPGGSRTYEGRILSYLEFLPFKEGFLDLSAGKLDEDEALGLFRQYLRAIGIPARKVLRLPPQVMVEVMEDFLSCQLRAMGETVPEREVRRMSGNSSQRKANAAFGPKNSGLRRSGQKTRRRTGR